MLLRILVFEPLLKSKVILSFRFGFSMSNLYSILRHLERYLKSLLSLSKGLLSPSKSFLEGVF